MELVWHSLWRSCDCAWVTLPPWLMLTETACWADSIPNNLNSESHSGHHVLRNQGNERCKEAPLQHLRLSSNPVFEESPINVLLGQHAAFYRWLYLKAARKQAVPDMSKVSSRGLCCVCRYGASQVDIRLLHTYAGCFLTPLTSGVDRALAPAVINHSRPAQIYSCEWRIEEKRVGGIRVCS